MIGTLYTLLNTRQKFLQTILDTAVYRTKESFSPYKECIYKTINNAFYDYRGTLDKLSLSENQTFITPILMTLGTCEKFNDYIDKKQVIKNYLEVITNSSNPSKVEEILFLTGVVNDLFKGKSKDKALKDYSKVQSNLSSAVLKALSIFKDSTSFSDVVAKTKGEDPLTMAIALNLGEAFYPYISNTFMSSLLKKVPNENIKYFFINYLNERDYLLSASSFNKDSKIMYIKKKTPGSLDFVGKDLYSIYNFFINHTIFEIFNADNVTIDFKLTKERDLNETYYYVRDTYRNYYIYNQIKLLFDGLKSVESRDSLEKFKNDLIPLTNKILDKLHGNVEQIILFDNVTECINYLRDNNITERLFKPLRDNDLFN